MESARAGRHSTIVQGKLVYKREALAEIIQSRQQCLEALTNLMALERSKK
jgi:hypothetical protein